MRDETLAIHAGYVGDSTRAVAVPIYQTVAHEFVSAEQAGAIFDLVEPGFHYNRLNNPTNAVLEARLTALEGGAGALLTASGMAAINVAVLTLVDAGSSLVTTPQLYGATYTWFAHVLPTLGVEVRFAADDRPETIARLIDETTRLVFCESIGNPAGNIIDIAGFAEVAHAAGVPLIVDNTVATPLLLKPIRHGADIVLHSLTKFIGGHGTTLGGAVIDAGTFDWVAHAARFPMFTSPEPAFHDVVYARDFPRDPFAVRARTVQLRNAGATLAPMNAFLLLQGLETLAVRLDRHEANARAIATWLSQDSRVAWVNSAALPGDPNAEFARRYLGGHVPSLLTFGVAGSDGRSAGLALFDAVGLFKRLVNLGDAKSLISHPASTTHRQLRPAELASAGIAPETIRLSVGLEHIDDLLDDLDQALAVATGAPRRRGSAAGAVAG